MRMRIRSLSYRGVVTVVFVACGVAAPLRAQTDVEHPPVAASGVPSPTLSEAGEPLVALAARGETPAAFGRRCIPADCVAPPSNIPDILGRRALSAGRLAALGATLDFHHGLLGECGCRHPDQFVVR